MAARDSNLSESMASQKSGSQIGTRESSVASTASSVRAAETRPVGLPGIGGRLSKEQIQDLAEKQFGASGDDLSEPDARLTKELAVSAMVALLAVFVFGWNNGNINSPSGNIQSALGLHLNDQDVWDPDTWIWSAVVSLFSVGALPGALYINQVSKAAGRKKAIVLSSVVFALGGIVEAASKWVAKGNQSSGVVVLMLGRFVSGVAAGGTTAVVPVYLGEIAPVQLRGAFGTAFQLICVVAMTIVQIIGLPGVFGSEQGWPWLFAAVVPLSVLLIASSGGMLESPQWLLRQAVAAGDGAEGESLRALAEENLRRLRGVDSDGLAGLPGIRNPVAEELEEIGMQIEEEQVRGVLSLREVFTDSKTRFPLTISLLMMAGQQFSGINNAFNYSTTFLKSNGLTQDTCNLVMIIMNLGNLAMTLAATYLMDRAGRRTLCLSSASGMLLTIVLLTAALKASITALCIVAVVGFVGVFGAGMGPIPWLLATEILPQEALPKGGSAATVVNWGSNFVVAMTFGPISNALGNFSFVPNAVLLGLFILFMGRHMPETKGKTLEQIQAELAGQGHKQDEAEEGLVGAAA